MNKLSMALLGTVLVALAVVGHVVLTRTAPQAPMPAASLPAAEPASAPARAPAPEAASEPAPAVAGPPSLPPLPADDTAVTAALVDLLGRQAVLTLLQTDRFAERVVATVDNLPRSHVAPRLWPVNPTAGRFSVDEQGHIAAANAPRYAPFVRLVDGVSPAAAAERYQRLAPQLQAAYEQLGYPGRSFHERLLEVIDHLLATPTVAAPLAVRLTEVKGPIPSERPWVRYEFADPALQSLSAGQRILLRVGEAHQRRLTAWLRAFRAQVAPR